MDSKQSLLKQLEVNPYFAHLSLSEGEALIDLARTESYPKGAQVRLEKELAYPIVFSGFVNGRVVPRGHFLGTFPFTRYSDITDVTVTAPSKFLVWDVDKLAGFMCTNPTVIPPYLLALHDHGHLLTEFGIGLGKCNSRIFGFLNPDGTDIWNTVKSYATSLYEQNPHRRVCIIDLDSDITDPPSLIEAVGTEFDLTDYTRPIPEEQAVHWASLQGAGEEDLELIGWLIFSLYQRYNYVLFHFGSKWNTGVGKEVLRQCHRIFVEYGTRKQELDLQRFFVDESLHSHAVHVHPVPAKHSWDRLLPEAPVRSYALSLGPSLRTTTTFLGGLKALDRVQKPGVIMAAGWSALIAAVYGMNQSIGDVYEFCDNFLDQARDGRKYKKIFEIIFPKTGIIDYPKFRKFLRNYFGLVRMEELSLRLVFRAVDPKNGHLIFLDQGQLVDNLIFALRLPGVLSYPKSDDYIGYSGDYFYGEEKTLAYFRRMHYRYSLHFSADEGATESEVAGQASFFDFLMQPYFHVHQESLNYFPVAGKFNRQIVLPGAQKWSDFFNWRRWADTGDKIVSEFLETQEDFVTANLRNA